MVQKWKQLVTIFWRYFPFEFIQYNDEFPYLHKDLDNVSRLSTNNCFALVIKVNVLYFVGFCFYI